jgi:F-type H+-transporting ATPase subunit delta
MSESTVAIRYAQSLFGLAEEKKVVEEVYNDMLLFKQVAEENRPLMLALKSPVVRHEKKIAVLKALFEKRVNPVSYTIFEIVTKKNREGILYAIADEFVKLYDISKGIVVAHVSSAVALSDELRQAVSQTVANSTGKTVQLSEKIDERLIGGFVLRVGDRQIDASIRKRLSDLKLSLLN